VLLAFEPTVDLLCCDEDDGRASFLEFTVSRLKLSQLPVAVGSPGSTKEYEYKRFAAVVGQADYIAFGRGKREIRRHVARVQCIGVCSEHRAGCCTAERCEETSQRFRSVNPWLFSLHPFGVKSPKYKPYHYKSL
jgi:hypothetical protein